MNSRPAPGQFRRSRTIGIWRVSRHLSWYPYSPVISLLISWNSRSRSGLLGTVLPVVRGVPRWWCA
jgi:hypothetical protein